MKLTDLGDPNYISLRSFRKNGTGVDTPLWAVADAGKLYAWTQADSWKVKRVRRNGAVQIAICDMKGNLDGEWVDARATIDDDSDEEKQMRKRLAKKYGVMYWLIGWLGNLIRRGGASTVLVIEDVE